MGIRHLAFISALFFSSYALAGNPPNAVDDASGAELPFISEDDPGTIPPERFLTNDNTGGNLIDDPLQTINIVQVNGITGGFTGTAGSWGEKTVGLGRLNVNFDGQFYYEAATYYDFLAAGDTTDVVFTYTITDQVDFPNATATVTLTIQGVNDVPQATNLNAGESFTEDDGAFSLVDIAVTDPDDNDTITATLTVSDPNAGALSANDGATYDAGTGVWTISDTVSNVNTALSNVQFSPASNYGQSFTIATSVVDAAGSGPAAGSKSVTVTAVNDAPTFTKGTNQTVDEDAGPQTAAAWATAIDEGGGSDEAGQTLNFNIVNNSNPGLFAVGPAIDPVSGDLTYTPADDANGSATIEINLSDDGGVANGGSDTSGNESFTITVDAVNDAPTFTKGVDETINEDAGAQSVAGWATGIDEGGGSDEDGQTLTFTTSTTNDGAFAALPAVDETSGNLTYEMNADFAGGPITVTVTLTDTGGTANGGDDVSQDTFTITVDAVNDAPTFTKGADQTVDEDAGPQTVAGWATAIDEGGGSDEDGQTLTFNIVNNSNPGLFAAGPAIDSASGDLTFTPADDANGSATIEINLSDDGGVANGGSDTSGNETFTITVDAVNDAPTFTKGANQTVNEDAGPQTAAAWATAIDEGGGSDEDGQTLTFNIVSNSNPGLFTAGPAINPVSGDLTYTPADDANGSATIEINLSDDGGTPNGGSDTSANETFTITVSAVNDAPTFTKGADQTIDEDAGAQIVAGWATGIDEGGGSNEDAQMLTFTTSTTNDGAFAALPAVDEATGDLTYEMGADFTGGPITVTVTLADSGGTANGGDDDTEDTFTITVDAVNDAPTFTVGPNLAINEDDGPQANNGFIADGSPGPADESGQALSYQVTSDASFFATQPAITPVGRLTYEVAEHVSGTTTVTVVLQDDGGTANGGVDTSAAQTFDIVVTAVADKPTLSTNTPLTTDEDVAVALGINAALVDTDGSEDLTVEISGLPAGAEISDGVNSSSAATTDVSFWAIGSITVVSNPHDDSDFALTVRATATEGSNGDDDFIVEAINVTVDAVSDTPNLTVANAVTNEDTPVSLTITSSLVDTDGSETLVIELTGVEGTLSAGTDNGGGSWTLSQAQLAGLQLSPIANSDNDFTIAVEAIATDGAATPASNTDTIDVTINPVSDAPNLTVTNSETENEDTVITLDIAGSLNDVDGSETLTFELSGVEGELSAGTDNGGGNWELTAAEVAGLTLTPIEHSDVDFTITVDAIATDGGAAAATTTDTINVTLNPVTDVPLLSPQDEVADEDAVIGLQLGAALVDTDGSENLSITLTGVEGQLNSGTPLGGGGWLLTAAQAAGLQLTPIEHSDVDFVIGIEITAQDGVAAPETVTDTLSVTLDAVSDAPDLTVSDASGDEDTSIPLSITAALVDTDGSESLSIELSGVEGTLNAGTDNGGGSWTLAPADLAGLEVAPPADSADDFVITVEAIATDGGATPASTVDTISVTVNEINDAPVVDDQSFDVDEEVANGTVVGTLIATNVETFETLSYALDGTAFAIDASGVITVADSAQIDYETTTSFTLTATVTDDGVPPLDDTATVEISLNDLNDNAPAVTGESITVDELDSDTFNVLDNDSDADLPAQTLTVSAVDGSAGDVGSAIDVISGGETAGTLTIQSDGSAEFIANPDVTVEVFTGSVTYTVSDGEGLTTDGTIDFTINPINDNQPELTADGDDLVASGLVYEEDEHLNFSRKVIVLSELFLDYDIDSDGLLDSSTGGDLDSLDFVVQNNTNSFLIQTNISGNDLEIWSPNNEHGSGDLTIRATDTAAPAINISSVDLTFTVTVESVNDAPLVGDYSDKVVDEDSGDIVVPLDSAFSDADLTDSDPSDEQLTYTITIIDKPNEFVTTGVIDESNLPGATITNGVPAAGQRTIEYVTTDSSVALQLAEDAHGEADVTVRGTDLGRPPAAPADPVFLFDEDSFTITVNALGDDTPEAVDDHYDDFPELVIQEDSDPIVFNPTINDDHGDVPITIILAGQQFVDDGGGVHRYRSSTRQADPLDTGSLQTVANGQVSCADSGCLDDETADTTIDASGVGPTNIVYQPAPNFHGEDSFTYCIQDESPGSEPAFTPPADVRCATVTVLVEPVNDKPIPQEPIQFVMTQAEDLECGSLECLDPNVQEGLRAKIRDIDSTHIDGQGCDPLLDSCTPSGDTLYFNLKSAVTEHGQLLPPFETDGSFTYRPDATFAGEDFFVFDVCDAPGFTSDDNCVFDVQAYVVIEPLEGAPPGSVDDVVEFDFQLSQVPLELVVGPEPNVLIVNDDSGSMDWDILTDQSSGVYFFDSGEDLRYVMKATAGNQNVAASEEASPGQGLWRLRNSKFNTIYYNPENRYTPWEGLDTSDVEFPDSPPTAARHNPLTSTPVTNLTIPQNYQGYGVAPEDPDCDEQICIIPDWFGGGCLVYADACPGGSDVGDMDVENFYIPRYYQWDDKDGDGNLDAVPSPATDPANAEGILVEIKPGADGGSDTYTKYEKRTDCDTIDGFCTYEEELQNFANWFTYSRNREFTAKSALGKVVASAENIRIGYAKLNSGSNIAPIKSMNSSARTGEKADLLDAIYQTNSSGGTPLRRALRNAGRHFECQDNDIFGSNSDSNPGDAGCPILAAPDGNCQQNFTLLMSDGAWNGGNPFIGDADDDNNTNFDGGRYAGSTDNTLADVAMYYYERDLHPGLDDEVPTTARDQEGAAANAFADGGNEVMHQHMTTFTVGFGVNGIVEDGDVPTDYTQSFDWGSPNNTARKIDDARHAAVNGRGAYLSAGDSSSLAQALLDAFEEFSSGSGAASAVSFNSQEIQEETLIFRAFYNTKINTGDLVAIPFTDAGLGETPAWQAASRMDLVDDDDREILTWNPESAQGIPFRPLELTQSQRNVFVDSPPVAADPGSMSAQHTTEVTQRVNYLRGDPTNERPEGNFRERPINNGRLGDIVHSSPVFVGPPNRLGRNAEPYPQGDGQYSGFASTNAGRQDVIYVSANDGMLHGFNADTGDEIFGFVPNNLMLNEFSRNITNLLDFNYEHRYFVDLTPALNDVYIDKDGDGTKEWVTILIGGHGAGGKAYFALDVTDVDALTEANAENVVLWEFTEDDDAYPTAEDEFGNVTPLETAGGDQRQDLQDPPQPVKDLGYTFSVPTIAMSNLTENVGGETEHRWIAVAGNGYNSTAGIAKLFVLFLEGGIDGTWCHPDLEYNDTIADDGSIPAECDGEEPDFLKLNTGFGVQDGLPNGLGIPRLIDVDSNGTVDYVYAGDYFGNLFRFDLTSDDYDDWSVTKIFEATYDDGGTPVRQPITTQPIVVEHPSQPDGFIVIFATGSYITVPDGTSTEIQSIYGLWDRLAPELIEKSELVQQRYTNVDDPDLGRVRFLSTNIVDYNDGKKGWYNDLDSVGPDEIQFPGAEPEFPGERAIRRILLRGGLVFVNSVIPKTQNSCIRVAGGSLLSFCPETGGANCVIQSVFDVNNDGSFDELVDGDQFVTGVLIEDAKPPTDSGFLEDKLITQVGEELFVVETDTKRGNNTGRISWKQLDDIP